MRTARGAQVSEPEALLQARSAPTFEAARRALACKMHEDDKHEGEQEHAKQRAAVRGGAVDAASAPVSASEAASERARRAHHSE
jgi:hypothetical protein